MDSAAPRPGTISRMPKSGVTVSSPRLREPERTVTGVAAMVRRRLLRTIALNRAIAARGSVIMISSPFLLEVVEEGDGVRVGSTRRFIDDQFGGQQIQSL